MEKGERTGNVGQNKGPAQGGRIYSAKKEKKENCQETVGRGLSAENTKKKNE